MESEHVSPGGAELQGDDRRIDDGSLQPHPVGGRMSAPSAPPTAREDRLPEELCTGAVIQGKYLVQEVIGRGGMCIVVAAIHLALEHLVALKVLRGPLAENQEAVQRFMREARSAAYLKSEHAAHVFDVGVLDTGQPYMVMEHLEGRDLGALLASGVVLSTTDAVDYILQACEAIGEAHAAGIVHRDIKPENLFLTRRADGEPRLKVLDFGIATAMQGSAPGHPDGLALTRGSTTFGTPPYMAPEQLCDARDVDPRSDIYALGVTLYELISGRLPFEGNSCAEVYGAIVTQRAAPLQQHDPTVPAALDRVVAQCLARNRNDRFASVADLAVALVPFGPARDGRDERQVLRSLSSGHPQVALETQSAVAAAGLDDLPAGSAVDRSTNEAVPTGADGAMAQRSAPRKPRALGIATIVAAATAVTMIFTSAAAGVVDSPAVAALPPASSSLRSSLAAPVPTTSQEPGCLSPIPAVSASTRPASSGSRVAIGRAPSTASAAPAKTFNPYAERK